MIAKELSSASESALAIELRGVTKRFGAIAANTGINLRIQRGTIHGIVGENGAGKSTAMKILYGLHRPDAGQIFVNGQEKVWRSPADAIASGIGMVHQHFLLAGPYPALDNILLGAETVSWGMLDRNRARVRLENLARQYGLAVDWDCPVDELSAGLQQRIEILKLLYRDAEILILDEPTAVLTPGEVSGFFRQLQTLREKGKTILLVTHKLNEVIAFTDRITVMRAGKVTGEKRTPDVTAQELAELMVGRKVLLRIEVTPVERRPIPADQLTHAPGSPARADGCAREAPGPAAALELKHLFLAGSRGRRDRLSNVSFRVQRGEIVGLAGIEGNGQAELVQALLHPREASCLTSGSVEILGRDVTSWSTGEIRELGVAVIPEDRLRDGLLPDWSLAENFLLGLQRRPEHSRSGWINWNAVEINAAAAINEFDVRPGEVSKTAGTLSGGNQQKFVLAREFQRKPDLLIAAQPTRGVDIGAIEFVHQRIVRARNEGAGVLLVSSELGEILALSDRILVLYGGHVVAEFGRGQVSERELGLKMGGA
jgi:general nucleoside transport system ATP-binding protein